MASFLVEETTVRQGGESPVISVGESTNRHILLTLCISHVIERQNLDIDVFASEDGVTWSSTPVASFLQKFCCGTYDMIVLNCRGHFLKAVWRVNRWGHNCDRPLCRFSLAWQDTRHIPENSRVMAGAA